MKSLSYYNESHINSIHLVNIQSIVTDCIYYKYFSADSKKIDRNITKSMQKVPKQDGNSRNLIEKIINKMQKRLPKPVDSV